MQVRMACDMVKGKSSRAALFREIWGSVGFAGQEIRTPAPFKYLCEKSESVPAPFMRICEKSESVSVITEHSDFA